MSETNIVSPLRQRMIEDMAARKLNPHTQRSHIHSCKRFAAWLKRSPDTATPDEVRRFQLHLIESGTSICNRNRIMTGVRFLFRVTLRRHDLAAEVWHIKEPERLPPVLSPEEVKRVLTMATSLKARAMLTLAYGCGLRAGEVVRLQAGDIDSEQKIIRIVQSKGRKDRHVMLPAEVLKLLRQWWKVRPTASNNDVAPEHRWLFPGRRQHQPMTTRSVDCSRRPQKPRGCARRSLCIHFATALRPICSSAARTFASFKRCSDIPSPRRQPATVAWRSE
jgi:integrase/recombinase XerD